MDSSKLRDALGEQLLDPWPLQDLLFPTDADWHRVRDGEPFGSPELLERVLYRNPRRASRNDPGRDQLLVRR
jgi:hypothetical protein